jgi:hypothetical protein
VTPKRPRDSNQLAKRIVDIATGEESEETVNEARSNAGKKGGPARAKSLTPEQRADIAREAANARWSKKD